jgi:hypothetical protein
MEEEISNKPEDISNKTIVVLVILTVVISVLGAVVVFSEVGSIQLQSFHSHAGSESSTGKVSLEVLPRQPTAEPTSTAGYVTLELKPREK